ncbi:Uncharacterised protein [Metamycoplasma cloacale]|uniref:Uncharacterized protein n=1 Tax=Metamycoplasma cloacale TaxID=92401 RepID=A0A2Z4LNL8_9BACT|nr:aromatic motif membrane protein [Metamycoplasma cloacale]AWX42857.1 hypothetical protein DK849_02155 [Metamycoplasma cloacale]VEU79321.1 Uncharacterised protein [Metamycoplasma cloacale]
MLKIKNLIITATLCTLPLCTISCKNYSNQNKKILKNLLNPDDDVKNSNVIQDDAKRTKIIIEDILLKIFKNNQLLKTKYLNQQNDLEYQIELLKQITELTKIIKENKQNRNKIEELNNLYSTNWYFIFNNLNKFELVFKEWFILPAVENSSMSNEYIQHISTLNEVNTHSFDNNYLEKLEEGEESAESVNSSILYLLKDNGIFRFRIINESSENPIMKFNSENLFFPNFQGDYVSLQLISNIFHSAVIHGIQNGYDRFENDVIKKKKYNEPATMLLLLKEDNYV